MGDDVARDGGAAVVGVEEWRRDRYALCPSVFRHQVSERPGASKWVTIPSAAEAVAMAASTDGPGPPTKPTMTSRPQTLREPPRRAWTSARARSFEEPPTPERQGRTRQGLRRVDEEVSDHRAHPEMLQHPGAVDVAGRIEDVLTDVDAC